MKVRLKVDISGSRNGAPWPGRSSIVELPDDEAARMCQNGMAVPVDGSEDDVETAVPNDDSSRRGLTTMTAAATVPHQQDASGALIPAKDDGGNADGDAKPSTAPARKTAAAKKAAAKPPAAGK